MIKTLQHKFKMFLNAVNEYTQTTDILERQAMINGSYKQNLLIPG